MAKLLVAPDVVAIRMGLEGADALNDDRQATLTATIAAATVHLAEYLRQKTFEQAAVSDTFVIDSDESSETNPIMVKLALSNGFLTDTAPVIKLSPLWEDLGTADAIDETYIQTDKDLGAVRVMRNTSVFVDTFAYYRTGHYFASVDYTAGFTHNSTTNVFDNVPDWLAEAATICALYGYKAGLDCKEVTAAQLVEKSGAVLVLRDHIRWVPGAVTPLLR